MKCEWMLGKHMLCIICVYRYTGPGAGAQMGYLRYAKVVRKEPSTVLHDYRYTGPGAGANGVFQVCTGVRKRALNSSPRYRDATLRDGDMRGFDRISGVPTLTIYVSLRNPSPIFISASRWKSTLPFSFLSISKGKNTLKEGCRCTTSWVRVASC